MHSLRLPRGYTTLDHQRNANTERFKATDIVEEIQGSNSLGNILGKNGVALHSRTDILSLSKGMSTQTKTILRFVGPGFMT
jgi:hypothetical protein